MLKLYKVFKQSISNSSGYDTYKVVLLGDGSNKTELFHKFVSNKFQKNHLKTIGIGPYSRYEMIDGRKILFSIWDVNHQEKFKLMRGMFYRNTISAFVVFDVTNLITFLNVDKWIDELKNESLDVHIILIGIYNNKEHVRKVTVEQIQAKVKELGAITYIETSIKSGEYIEEAFALLGKRILEGQ